MNLPSCVVFSHIYYHVVNVYKSLKWKKCIFVAMWCQSRYNYANLEDIMNVSDRFSVTSANGPATRFLKPKTIYVFIEGITTRVSIEHVFTWCLL